MQYDVCVCVGETSFVSYDRANLRKTLKTDGSNTLQQDKTQQNPALLKTLETFASATQVCQQPLCFLSLSFVSFLLLYEAVEGWLDSSTISIVLRAKCLCVCVCVHWSVDVIEVAEIFHWKCCGGARASVLNIFHSYARQVYWATVFFLLLGPLFRCLCQFHSPVGTYWAKWHFPVFHAN